MKDSLGCTEVSIQMFQFQFKRSDACLYFLSSVHPSCLQMRAFGILLGFVLQNVSYIALIVTILDDVFSLSLGLTHHPNFKSSSELFWYYTIFFMDIFPTKPNKQHNQVYKHLNKTILLNKANLLIAFNIMVCFYHSRTFLWLPHNNIVFSPLQK